MNSRSYLYERSFRRLTRADVECMCTERTRPDRALSSVQAKIGCIQALRRWLHGIHPAFIYDEGSARDDYDAESEIAATSCIGWSFPLAAYAANNGSDFDGFRIVSIRIEGIWGGKGEGGDLINKQASRCRISGCVIVELLFAVYTVIYTKLRTVAHVGFVYWLITIGSGCNLWGKCNCLISWVECT